jgi:hypothetical protein
VNEARLDHFRQFRRERFPGVLRQHRLGIECINMADAAVHVQVDHAFGFGRQRGGFRQELFAVGGFHDSSQRRHREPTSSSGE